MAKLPILNLLLLLCQVKSVQGQHLYFFSVIETSLLNRPDRSLEAQRLHKLVTEIARHGKYTLHWYDFGDSISFTPNTVRKTLKTFSPQSPDVDLVWFYYTGKGYSDNPKAWPTLELNGGNIAVRELLAELRKKAVRTLLVTTDCGNKPYLSDQLHVNNGLDTMDASKVIKPIVTVPKITESANIDIVNMHLLLFRPKDIRQIIVMTSASVGQRAYSSTKYGSIWLTALIQAFSDLEVTFSGRSLWKKMHEKVIQLVHQRTNNRQTPLINRQTITCCDESSN